MNNIKITTERMSPDVSLVEMNLSAQTESTFNQHVFPHLFDGRTSGSRTPLRNGRVKYSLLIYDVTLVQALKQVLINAILIENGQMN